MDYVLDKSSPGPRSTRTHFRTTVKYIIKHLCLGGLDSNIVHNSIDYYSVQYHQIIINSVCVLTAPGRAQGVEHDEDTSLTVIYCSGVYC